VKRDIPAACEQAVLVIPGGSSEHLGLKILEDGIRNFVQGRDAWFSPEHLPSCSSASGLDHMAAVVM
jgi:hypothetical protein